VQLLVNLNRNQNQQIKMEKMKKFPYKLTLSQVEAAEAYMTKKSS